MFNETLANTELGIRLTLENGVLIRATSITNKNIYLQQIDLLLHVWTMDITTESVIFQNTTAENPQEADTLQIALFLILILVLMISGILGNLLVLVTIIKSTKASFRQQGFIINLAIADIVYHSIGPIFSLATTVNSNKWPFDQGTCSFVGYVLMVCVEASSINLALIAFYRYVSIVHIPLSLKLFNKTNIILMMCSVWGYAGLISILPVFGWGRYHFSTKLGGCMYDWGHSASFRIFVGISVFLLPVILIGYFYSHILLVAIKSRRKVHVGTFVSNSDRTRNRTLQMEEAMDTSTDDVKDKTNHHRPKGTIPNTLQKREALSRQEIRLVLQLLFIFLWFVVCWSPYLILAIILDPYEDTYDKSLYTITAFFTILNTIVNPIIYFLSNKTLRKEARLILCYKKSSQGIVSAGTTMTSHM